MKPKREITGLRDSPTAKPNHATPCRPLFVAHPLSAIFVALTPITLFLPCSVHLGPGLVQPPVKPENKGSQTWSNLVNLKIFPPGFLGFACCAEALPVKRSVSVNMPRLIKLL